MYMYSYVEIQKTFFLIKLLEDAMYILSYTFIYLIAPTEVYSWHYNDFVTTHQYDYIT